MSTQKIAATEQVWDAFIADQAKAMEEWVVENLKVEVTDEMREQIASVLGQQTDDHGSIFKTAKRGRKAGAKNSVADDSCRCCALTIKDGAPVRCTRKRKADEGDYCQTHSKQCSEFGGKPKYGRHDEEVPLTYTKTVGGIIQCENVPIAWTSEAEIARMETEGIPIKRKGKRGRRPRKDSGDAESVVTKSKGKRAPSAYNLFMKDPVNRAKVEGNGKEKMVQLAAMWKEATEETKRPYEEEAARLKEEVASNSDSSDAASVSSSTKKKTSAYKLFKKDNKDIGDLATIKQAWRDADKETKAKYTEMARDANFDEDAPISDLIPKKRASKKAKKVDVPAPASGAGADTPEPVKEAEEVEVDLDSAVDAFCEDEEEKEISSNPRWISKKDKKEYFVDEDGFLFDVETEAPVGTVESMGGPDAFFK